MADKPLDPYFTPPPDDDGGDGSGSGKDSRGGKRKGAGPPTKAEKSSYQSAASMVRYVERAAVGMGGEHWRMDKEEKKDIVDPLAKIFATWQVTNVNNPYAALLIASFGYAFGRGKDGQTRGNIGTVVSNIKDRIKPDADDATDAADDTAAPEPDDNTATA